MSVWAPDEPFSAGTAMERNTLVVAAADLAVVAHVRLKEGGTWFAATDALRRRTTPVAVRCTSDDPAARALIALGARPLAAPGELGDAIGTLGRWGGLFEPDGKLPPCESHRQDAPRPGC